MSIDTVLVVTFLTFIVFLIGELIGHFNSRKRIRELEAKLDAVSALPEKWRKFHETEHSYICSHVMCADELDKELEAAIKGEES